jgi:hypothetical protein
MMPDSLNNRLVLFDPFSGSVVNSNAFALAGGTPLHAMQVGGEIWVSEQVGDRVSRWSFGGASLGAITGALDNIRGMEQVGGTVFVTNFGTGNGAPGPSLRMFDTSGNSMGHFLTPRSTGPFGALDVGGDLLVSSSNADDDVHKYTTAGVSLGTFHNSTSLNFAEQMNLDAAGNVMVAGFSSNNVVTLNSAGSIVGSFAASGARGVYQLGNGNILWSNGSGAHIFNVGTGGSTQIYSGGGRYFDILVVPEPATVVTLLAGVALAARRRRK